jgi:hypothetical protein
LPKQFDNNNNNNNNNHVVVEENFQRRFSVNVWCGIFGNRLEWWVPFLLMGFLIKKKTIKLFIIKRNKQLSA